ncbi:MAG: hypothetical protein Kow0056_06420 [Coriobacteriia bacterium]
MNVRGDKRFRQVGLDRPVRLYWMERTVTLLQSGLDDSEIKRTLQAEMEPYFQSDANTSRGSLDKTITVLMRIWVRTPQPVTGLRGRAVELLPNLAEEERIAVHWGMTMAVYPFWGSVALSAGRLLRLQGRASARQVQLRLREQYGQRETVSRRARYVLRSYHDWGVLRESGKRGVYVQGSVLPVAREDLTAWLVEALLLSVPDGRASWSSIKSSQRLFPFRLETVSAVHALGSTASLEIVRHALDDELVALRRDE